MCLVEQTLTVLLQREKEEKGCARLGGTNKNGGSERGITKMLVERQKKSDVRKGRHAGGDGRASSVEE
jgi:hypothetical protein